MKGDIKMSKKIKRTISLMMIILTLFLMFSVNVNAQEKNTRNVNYDDQISLCWNNVISTSLNLGFSSTGKINASVRMIGSTGTKYKNGTIKIDRYTGSKWVNVKTWSSQASSSSVFSFSSTTLTALSNTKYRLTIEITAYNGSSSEVISLSKTSTNS